MGKVKTKKCDYSKDGCCIRNMKYCCPEKECLGLTQEILNKQLKEIEYKYEKE